MPKVKQSIGVPGLSRIVPGGPCSDGSFIAEMQDGSTRYIFAPHRTGDRVSVRGEPHIVDSVDAAQNRANGAWQWVTELGAVDNGI